MSWIDIGRLGIVQAALASIVVLTNSTLNRVMIVELGLAAVVPGLLVGIHYAVQLSRPMWGHRSDTGGSRTVWILAGLGTLALAGTLASSTTYLFAEHPNLGFVIAVLAYVMIGMGIGASGTSLLALLATRTATERRAAAATITWMMMIFGIIVTSIATGIALEPYSHGRLVTVTAATGIIALLVAWLAVRGIEQKPMVAAAPDQSMPPQRFRDSLRDVWGDRQARILTLFIFLSMFAFSTQDLILEPFAGLLFGMTPGQSTQLSGLQHGGVLLGMAAFGLAGIVFGKRVANLPRLFIIIGCLGSAGALAFLCIAATIAPNWPLPYNVFLLGLANGMFSVAAIGTMMSLAAAGAHANAGMRIGAWGAAQALAFGLGGLFGSFALDLGRGLAMTDGHAFATVFGFEAILFMASAGLALAIGNRSASTDAPQSCSPLLQPAE
ncbi:BCD family MFS transporter [Ciceribacter sp. L1K23]|uniref:BCD family MFS transporter n=1 Tax=Ciceribacter sp. L1K23 TaxID=2820276 RepID=UPI0020126896|nr:BCD family MFS transporter [Ciceribacter sp. L1K23]